MWSRRGDSATRVLILGYQGTSEAPACRVFHHRGSFPEPSRWARHLGLIKQVHKFLVTSIRTFIPCSTHAPTTTSQPTPSTLRPTRAKTNIFYKFRGDLTGFSPTLHGFFTCLGIFFFQSLYPGIRQLVIRISFFTQEASRCCFVNLIRTWLTG